MLSRNNSSDSRRVRRSKSSVSVLSRRSAAPTTDAFDAELSQLQALAAASLAMQRHRNRPSYASPAVRGLSELSHSFDGGRQQHTNQSSRQESVLSGDAGSSSYSRAAPTAETPLNVDEEWPSDFDQCTNEQRGPVTNSTTGHAASPRPSSYRRLRKSKSMFSTHRLLSSNESRHSPQKSGLRSASSGTGRLSCRTLRGSLSFFRGGSESNPASEAQPKPPALPIEVAREQLKMAVEQRRAAALSEPAVGRRPRADPKPFKKSMRSNGAHSQSTISAYTSSGTHSASKGRLFSFSIKNSLRRMFGRRISGSNRESPGRVRAQQHHLDSSEIESSEESSSFDSSSDYAHYCEQTSLHAITNVAPSIRSLKSLSSIATSNSRVTSWTDSTAGNTLTMKQPPSMLRQELGIIREDSDAYTPTPSPGRHRPHDGYSIFRQPRDNSVDIDSQRMFSALMRNIDETKKARGQVGSSSTQKARSGRGPSSNCSPSTIRAVKRSPTRHSTRLARESPSGRSQFSIRSNRTVELTPQEIARNNEAMIPRRQSQQTIRRLASNEPLSMLNSQIEPATGAMQYQGELAGREDIDSVIVGRSVNSPIPPLSPSVYSRITGAMSPYQTQNDVDTSDSDEERGTVTILDSMRLPYRPRGSGPSGNPIETRGGSCEWKTWVSSQMDLIDAAASTNSLCDPSFAITGHYRENAQIDSSPCHQHTASSPFTQSKLALDEVPSLSFRDRDEPKLEDDKVDVGLIEPLSIPKNNFSRPLRCSPSLSTCSTIVRKPTITTSSAPRALTPMICDSEMSPSPLSIRTRSVSRTPTTVSVSPLLYSKTRPDEASAVLEGSSTGKGNNSLKGRYEKSTSPLYRSDTKQLLQEIQFNSVRPRRETTSITKENKRGCSSYRLSERPNYASKLNGLHSTISTKRMVDIFISERSQGSRSSEDGPAEPAFL